MTPARRAVILADIRSARDQDWFRGYIGGLRVDGALGDVDVTMAVREKLQANGWPLEVPEWAR